MYRTLTLWKEHGGHGVVETNEQKDIIDCLKIAIDAMADRNIIIIVPGIDYHSYRNRFPDRTENLNNIFSITSRDVFYDVVFVVGIDEVSEAAAKMIQQLKVRHRLYFAKDYEKVPSFVSDGSPLLREDSKEHVEYNYIVPMSTEVQLLYDKVIETMSGILRVFRDYDNVTGCIAGANGLNAQQFRDNFADSNGWNKDLNLDVKMFAQIDKFYNPDNLFEQATLYNSLVRERENIISKSDDKIKHAVSTYVVNPNKKIVILCKGDDMCENIASAINRLKISPTTQAEAIHANTASRSLKDDEGNAVLVKSGANKGKVKMFGAKVVNDHILSSFNEGKLNAIVTTGTLNKGSIIKGIDLIICVSPKANNYFKLKSRLKRFEFKDAVSVINVTFNNDKDVGKFKYTQQSLGLKAIDAISLDRVIV